ncbi:uncharacterized protein LOC141588588 [Silene latifolia]|uniref:uncharacterized protein LOC141588588 n=1 Tax=Silene latifolia TaxID=37657 RepID=UPI003D773744
MPESTPSNPPTYDYFEDPLFLKTSDQPTVVLSSFLFEGHDFLGWKQEVFMSLASKNKDGFLDGTCVKPPITDKKFKQWFRCDFMVTKWILNSLDKLVRENLKYVKSAEELWAELLERHGSANAIEIYQLKKDLNAVIQDNLSLLEY